MHFLNTWSVNNLNVTEAPKIKQMEKKTAAAPCSASPFERIRRKTKVRDECGADGFMEDVCLPSEVFQALNIIVKQDKMWFVLGGIKI